MLQINTGKFFTVDEVRTNELRGVLHTNLRLPYRESIVTVAGTLHPTNALASTGAVIFEMTERLEGGVASGVILSHGIDPYLAQFAQVVSFGLNGICAVDPFEVERLTSPRPLQTESDRPASVVRWVFDRQVHLEEADLAAFPDFVRDLLALDRRGFFAAMRAINGYVTGLRQLPDDRDLAYVLLVAALESLALGFDEFRPTWDDYDEQKRRTIDRSLQGLDEATKTKVRDAVLENEHVALSRRFRDATLARLAPAYFREEAAGQVRPAGRADLAEALRHAYRLRSAYLHEMKPLPRELTWHSGYQEIIEVDESATLTFQGLTRLLQHVIRRFVATAHKVEREAYNYSFDRAGVIRAKLAAEAWIHLVDGVTPKAGPKRLEGFLEQFVSLLDGSPKPQLSDIKDLLRWVDGNYAGMKATERRPWAALYLCWNGFLSDEERLPEYINRRGVYIADLQSLNLETVVALLVFQRPFPGSPSDQIKLYDTYLKARPRGRFRMPDLFEAALVLQIAESARATGDVATARDLVTRAVEENPRFGALRTLQTDFDPEKPIHWPSVLAPNSSLMRRDAKEPDASEIA